MSLGTPWVIKRPSLKTTTPVALTAPAARRAATPRRNILIHLTATPSPRATSSCSRRIVRNLALAAGRQRAGPILAPRR